MPYTQEIVSNLPTPMTRGSAVLALGAASEPNIPGHTAAASVVVSRVNLGGGGVGFITASLTFGGGLVTITFASDDATDTSELSWQLVG